MTAVPAVNGTAPGQWPGAVLSAAAGYGGEPAPHRGKISGATPPRNVGGAATDRAGPALADRRTEAYNR